MRRSPRSAARLSARGRRCARALGPTRRRLRNCRTSGRWTCWPRGRPDRAALHQAHGKEARLCRRPCRFRRQSSDFAVGKPARWRSARFHSAARHRRCRRRYKTPAPASRPSWEPPCWQEAFQSASCPFCFPFVPVPYNSSLPQKRAQRRKKQPPSNPGGSCKSWILP